LNTIASAFRKAATGKRKFGVLAVLRDNLNASRFRLGVSLRLTIFGPRRKGRKYRLTLWRICYLMASPITENDNANR